PSAGAHDDLNLLFSHGAMPMDQWTHIAATLDTSSGDMAIYINGALDATGNSGYPGTGIHTSTAPVWIGAVNGGSGIQYWDGRMDEVQLFNRALSATEIASICAAKTSGENKSGLDLYPPVFATFPYFPNPIEATSAAG